MTAKILKLHQKQIVPFSKFFVILYFHFISKSKRGVIAPEAIKDKLYGQLKYRFTLIGSGNVASWLAYSIQRSGSQIVQIYGRNPENAMRLARVYDTEAISDIRLLNSESEFYLFSLKDDAYASILEKLPHSLPFAVHTAGSVSQEIFRNYAKQYGVIYPYQTISARNDFSRLDVPLCIEANNENAFRLLYQLGSQWSNSVYPISELQRSYMHLAAVFASNFTNALYGIGYDILHQKGIDSSLIMPLLYNTLDKLRITSPSAAQTGPAIRHDGKTMEKHLSMLANEDVKQIYRLMSAWIQNYEDTTSGSLKILV